MFMSSADQSLGTSMSYVVKLGVVSQSTLVLLTAKRELSPLTFFNTAQSISDLAGGIHCPAGFFMMHRNNFDKMRFRRHQ